MAQHARTKTLRSLGLMLVAGATGGVVLLGSGGAAQAKDGVNWDAVAQCESGGNWGINTGNGYYGGLQFSGSTWKAYGGGKYASSANKASRSQQIRIAEKVLKGQGIGAWPTCGKKGGSSKSYKGTNTQGSSSSSKKYSSSSKKYSGTTKKYSSSAKSQGSTYRGTTNAKATGRTYVVRSGDTLAKIAAVKNVQGGWRALYTLNSGVLSNPNLIFPGQRLAL